MRERTEPDFAELAVAVYVEELAVDKRVLYVGDPSSAGPERLARVARSVDLVSPRARARGTRRGGRLNTRRWPAEDEAGRWDLVLVPDFQEAGLGEEGKLSEASRWLAKGGVLVAGTESRGDQARYERFYDLLQDAFGAVRMVGQAPFAGYSVVDFAPRGDLEVTFDGSLLSGEGQGAARYLALCSDREVFLDPYAVVQVPADAATPAPAPTVSADAEAEQKVGQLTERVRDLQDTLDAANVHAEETERELVVAREDLGSARDKLRSLADIERDARKTQQKLETRISSLEAELKSGGGGTDQEYVRLETALRECGRELSVSRSELGRRDTLVRDLVEELRIAHREAPGAATSFRPTDPAPSTSATDPVARAVSAEAEKAELGFRLDEVRGHLALSERRAASDLEELRRMEAALRGTVRGLNARLAEVTELYQQSRARLTLLEDDRRAVEAKNEELTRQLSLVRERLEFEIARAHAQSAGEPRGDDDTIQMVSPLAQTDPSALASPEAREQAAREGQLVGQLIRAREEAADMALEVRQARMEADLAKQAVSEYEERISGMVRGYQLRMAELTQELDRVGSEAERALIAEGERAAKSEALQRSEAALSGEVAGLRLRLADREAAVAALASAATTETTPTDPDELTRLREEIARLREDLQPPPAPEAPVDEEEPAAEAPGDDPERRLRGMLESQAALVGRLQGQLAQALDARRALERELEEKAAALEERDETVENAKVEADVHVGQSHRELEELMDRLEESETERRRAAAALEDSRAILAKLMADLPKAGEEPEDGGTELRRMRAQIRQLDSEAADREVLLRSLTAQLQERDDRLRALDRLEKSDDDGAEEDPQALRARLFEMEERVARLSEELEHERDARRRLEEG